MTPVAPTHLIRERTALSIGPPLWHAEQSVTPGGIRVTPCAEVIAPDLLEVRADDPEAGHDICPVCQEHLYR